MVGDTSDAVWGVMDIFPDTNFPDIRKKVTIRSKAGNLLIIPREGENMVRFYLELPYGTDPKKVAIEDLQTTAKRILSQYTLDIKHTYWWSAYSIGQRLADHFSKDNRVFLTGDACHTHSPKAGQGMNLSLQDGYNIGWKLATVLRGQAGPELLKTYNLEREKTASDLIDFDREFTRLFSSKADKQSKDAAKQFSEYFVKSGRYTAGLTTTYEDSMITNTKGSSQALAKHVTVGMRFPSAQVVRFSDARAMQLAKALQSTGAWRLLVFAGDPLEDKNFLRLDQASNLSRVHSLCENANATCSSLLDLLPPK
jgi:phenol 2-monooxygenase